MRTSYTLLILVLALGIVSSALAQDELQREELQRIIHDPVLSGTAGEALELEAYIEGDLSLASVVVAQVMFRSSDQDVYDFIEFVSTADYYYGEIPGNRVVSEGMEYYIEFIFDDGSSLTFPPSEENPSLNPIYVDIRVATTVRPQEPIVVISPEPNTTVSGTDVLIAVSFNPTTRRFDPAKIRLMVDSRDRTGEANVTDEILTAVLAGFEKGRHRIDLVYQDDTGEEVLQTWFFAWRPEASAARGFRSHFSGNLGFDTYSQRINAQTYNVGREKINIRGRFGSFSISGNALLTSQEAGNLQPQHRYLITVGWPAFRIRFGDVKPRYNELILWGKRVRGAEIDFGPGQMRLQLLYGDMTRPINGNAYTLPDTTWDYTDPENPAVVSIADSTHTTPGMYRRWMGATRLSFGDPSSFNFGWTVMKARDDTSSALYGKRPKDNLVTGFDFLATGLRRRVSLDGQIALSLYNDNISVDPIEDAARFRNIIWVNQYFEPLPSEGIPTDTAATQEVDVGKIVGSLLEQSLSYKGRLRLRVLYNDLRIGYSKINRSYRTFGNPTLSNDRAGFFVRDRIRLFSSKLYLNIGYNQYKDNVAGSKDVTTTRSTLNGGFSVYTGDVWPDLTVGYRNTLNKNDAELEPVYLDNTAIDTLDTRLQDQADNYTISLVQKLAYATTDNIVTLSFITTDRSDTYDVHGTSDMNIISMSVRSEYEMPLSTTVNFSSSSQNSIGGLTNLSYRIIGLRGDYYMMNKRLVPFLGPRITLASGTLNITRDDPGEQFDESDPTIAGQIRKQTLHNMLVDFTKIELLAGFEFQLLDNHALTGYLSMSSYSEAGQWEYWNDEKYALDMDNDGTIDNDGETVNFPTYYKKNDFMAMLSYQIRF